MESSDSKVRQATEADLEAIGELWWEMAEFHRPALPIPIKAQEEVKVQQKKYVQERLSDENALILIGEVEGRVVGYCRASVGFPAPVYEQQLYGSIAELSVSGQYRRRGIGEAMFQTTCAWFKSRGVQHIEVSTMTANPVSNAFWKKMGFATFREVKQNSTF